MSQVKHFSPISIEEHCLEPSPAGGVIHSTKQIDSESLDAFLSVTTAAKARRFVIRYLDFFGIGPIDNSGNILWETDSDFISARYVMAKTLEAVSLLKNEEVTRDDLRNFGFVLNEFSADDMKFNPDLFPDGAMLVRFGFAMDGLVCYRNYLEECCGDSARSKSRMFVEFWSDGNLSFLEYCEYFRIGESWARKAIEGFVNCIFTLHMKGIKTICVNGGTEERRADSALAMLWWLALDRMRNGRLGKCEVCGTPYITRGRERGERRKYCSDACRQWAKKHPGEIR